MYHIDVISLFPDLCASVFDYGVVRRARDLIQFRTWNPRDFATDKHRTVDDKPYGGGAGMVMKYEPLHAAITKAKQAQPDSRVLYLSPQGRRLDQVGVRELSRRHGIILVCGRYEGIDERLITTVIDEEWSIGDYVLSGGELATMVLIDSVCRLLPGVLGNSDSADHDSFVDGLLDYPHYTRPEQIADHSVPAVLLSGDHQQIQDWRMRQALLKTYLQRPDLIKMDELNNAQKLVLQELKDELE